MKRGVLVVIALTAIVTFISPAYAQSSSGENTQTPFLKRVVTLPAFPGTSASISVTLGDDNIAEIKALVTIDGRLIVLPLSLKEAAYSADFPAPRRSLEYQIVMSRSDNGPFVSTSYHVPMTCYEHITQAVESLELSDKKRLQIYEALKLQGEIASLEYAVAAVERLIEAHHTPIKAGSSEYGDVEEISSTVHCRRIPLGGIKQLLRLGDNKRTRLLAVRRQRISLLEALMRKILAPELFTLFNQLEMRAGLSKQDPLNKDTPVTLVVKRLLLIDTVLHAQKAFLDQR